MKIEFETATISVAEARGLVALLDALHGSAVLPVPVTITPHPETGATTARGYGPDTRSKLQMMKDGDWSAPDGYPTDPDQNPPTDQNPPEPTARDSAGIPWDERIHASTKTTTANGQWTRRRNTPDELFNSVMAELRAANTARTVEAAASLTAPSVPVVPAPPVAAPEPTAAEAFTPPASVVIPPAVPAPPVAEAVPTFLQIMQTVTAAQREGKLDKAKLDELLASCNMEGVAKLVSADEGTRSAFSALLSAHLA